MIVSNGIYYINNYQNSPIPIPLLPPIITRMLTLRAKKDQIRHTFGTHRE